MSSEYWNWKFRDVKPDEKRELTPKEKLRNWWHYHKWHMLIGIVILLVLADIGRHMLRIGEVIPDVQCAYVGASVLPEDTVTALEQALCACAEDANGDGRVIVRVNQYPSIPGGEDSSVNTNVDAHNYAYISATLLMADLETCDSFVFLLDDYKTFQENYQVLCQPDGTLPSMFDTDYDSLVIPWKDCPTLAALELGGYQETVAGMEVTGDSASLLEGLYVARRGFWNERTCRYPETCETFWNSLTEGAKR